MASFRCYDNFDAIATLIMTNFHLNTTVVAIFPNVCLWQGSLCLNLLLTLKNCTEPPSYDSTAYVVSIWPLFLFDPFTKNLGKLREFFGQMVYRPPPPHPPAKIFPYASGYDLLLARTVTIATYSLWHSVLLNINEALLG